MGEAGSGHFRGAFSGRDVSTRDAGISSAQPASLRGLREVPGAAITAAGQGLHPRRSARLLQTAIELIGEADQRRPVGPRRGLQVPAPEALPQHVDEEIASERSSRSPSGRA